MSEKNIQPREGLLAAFYRFLFPGDVVGLFNRAKDDKLRAMTNSSGWFIFLPELG